jgi:DNA-binding NarL/FixJ family response regulator
MSRARVLLADDHKGTAELLKSLLARDFELVAVVEDGLALVEAAKTLQPDVIVADISMPRLDGVSALGELKKENPQVKVIFTTMFADPEFARLALQAGAHGFVAKHSAWSELVPAILSVLDGRIFVSPSLSGTGNSRNGEFPQGTL